MKQTDTMERGIEFEDLVLKHLDVMYRSALHLTRNPIDAQDLVQEAVLRALRFHDKFKPGTYMKAWLLTIVRNTFINEYRRKVRCPETVELAIGEQVAAAPADKDVGYYPQALKNDNILEYLDDDVRRAVESLPDGHRTALIMADLQDMSYRDIADRLHCPLGTVMSRLHRSRRQLREQLADRRPVAACC